MGDGGRGHGVWLIAHRGWSIVWQRWGRKEGEWRRGWQGVQWRILDRGRRGGGGGHHLGQVCDGAEFRIQLFFLFSLESEPLPPPEQGAVLEHLDGLGVECPVGALARPVWSPGNLDEAVIEAEIVSEGVLPPLRVLPVIRKPLHDELVNLRQRQHPLGAVVEGHGCQGDVGVGGLAVTVSLAAGSRHLDCLLYCPVDACVICVM